jgi:uncharacterized protein (DUF2384 family)
MVSELLGGANGTKNGQVFDGQTWLRAWLKSPEGRPEFDGRRRLDIFELPSGAELIETELRRQVTGAGS